MGTNAGRKHHRHFQRLPCRRPAHGGAPAGGGAIVTVSSNAAATPRVGMGAYAASKAAVTQMTRCLRSSTVIGVTC
ncbi:SDR family NAD(P)-dependent oxidoreductase [Arhodomonas sp. AD133]|uniref:SDR family NAD(P)-dependent oxidoreductase n=1 Tax=Arhodomonas sp. AD133 TaxID=3415009 RepID=UPI003EB95CB9